MTTFTDAQSEAIVAELLRLSILSRKAEKVALGMWPENGAAMYADIAKSTEALAQKFRGKEP